MTAQLITLKKHLGEQGALTVGDDLPFAIKRFFILHEIANSVVRGGHAHRNQHQIMICLSGSVRVGVGNVQQFLLWKPEQALYVPPMNWCTLYMSACSVVLVLASGDYDEAEHIRNADEFRKLAA